MNKLRLRTKTPQEVRRTLNRVMNMVANDELDYRQANSIIRACNAVLIAIRVDEQQKKIDELETIIKSINNSN